VHLSQPVPTCPNVSQRLSTSFNASQPLATLQNPLDDDAPIATPQIARGDLGIVLNLAEEERTIPVGGAAQRLWETDAASTKLLKRSVTLGGRSAVVLRVTRPE